MELKYVPKFYFENCDGEQTHEALNYDVVKAMVLAEIKEVFGMDEMDVTFSCQDDGNVEVHHRTESDDEFATYAGTIYVGKIAI